MSLIVKESRLRASGGQDVKVEVEGARVRVVVVQPQFDAEGCFLGECQITIEGHRHFGGFVEFETPLVVTLVGVMPGEEGHMNDIATFAIESLANLEASPTNT